MYGVALEGGGARGAYHIGALKALNELGIKIDGIVGTSMGAFNAAVYAQGDFDALYDFWTNTSSGIVVGVKDSEITKFINKKIDLNSLKYWANYVKTNVAQGGMDVGKLKEAYGTYVDEEKLRKSKIDFGLATYSLTDLKPLYMTKEKIADGKLLDYIVGSSYLPVFKSEALVDGKTKFLDGGFYDNCPVKILLDKGYKNIIEIRTDSIGIKRSYNKKDLNVIIISPSKDIGSILFSDKYKMNSNINMGYFDTLRVMKGYIGEQFYVIPSKSDNKVFNMIASIENEKIIEIADNIKSIKKETIKTNELKKVLFEEILPYFQNKLKDKDTASYQKFIVSAIEYLFDETQIQMYKLYKFNELLEEAKILCEEMINKNKSKIVQNNFETALMKFILSLKY